jgi:hypothetical protein
MASKGRGTSLVRPLQHDEQLIHRNVTIIVTDGLHWPVALDRSPMRSIAQLMLWIVVLRSFCFDPIATWRFLAALIYAIAMRAVKV